MSNEFPLVSVILPLFNAQNYIFEAVDSVLKQTYKNFELIILNDGSTDDSLKIVSNFNDDRVIVINQENIGLSATLNKGINLAKGNLIARMDADDVCYPKRLEIQVRQFNQNPNLILLGTSTEYINDKGDYIATSIPIVGDRNIKHFLLNKGNVIAHPSVMFRKSVVEKVGGYCEKIGQYFEDHDLWVSMMNLGEFDNLETPLLKYRLTEGSISAINIDNNKFGEDVLQFLKNKRGKKALNYNIIEERKNKLSKISEVNKKQLFTESLETLKQKEKKMNLLMLLFFFLPLRQKLQLISFLRSKF